MAKQTINIGTIANDGTGSTLRAAGDLVNDNFNEIYTAIGDGTTLNSDVLTASSTHTLTNKSGNISQWTNDTGYITSVAETNDLSSAVTWANVPDVNITQSSVTQHQTALSITESQISDLQSYLTAEADTLATVTGRGATTTTTAVIPFYYANQAAFPNATTYHGAIAHSHSDGAMYFAHGGSWNKMANDSQLTNSTNWDTAYSWGDHSTAGYLTSLTGSGLTTLSDVDAVTGAGDDGKVLYYDHASTSFKWKNAGGGTFGIAGNTGTHTFDTATETLTFLGTTGQINADIAANNVSLSLAADINSITSIAFEGSTADANETKLQAIDPTADRTINLPDADGTVALTTDLYTDSDVDTHLNNQIQ